MHQINLDQLNLNDVEKQIVSLIVKKNGEIRSTKPKVTSDPLTGKAAYVWRMVMFYASDKAQHHCMPVCADFDLPAFDENNKWKSSIAREMSKELRVIEDEILKQIPSDKLHGLNRWKTVLGR